MEVSSDCPSDETDENGNREEIWDNIEDVEYSFIAKGKSKEPGMLTTHNMKFKVLDREKIDMYLSLFFSFRGTMKIRRELWCTLHVLIRGMDVLGELRFPLQRKSRVTESQLKSTSLLLSQLQR